MWDFAATIAKTVEWYVAQTDKLEVTQQQIRAYETGALAREIAWAASANFNTAR